MMLRRIGLSAAPGLESAMAEGDRTLVERTNGGKMRADNGMPLYLRVKDEKPGDTTGDGVSGVWHVGKP